MSQFRGLGRSRYVLVVSAALLELWAILSLVWLPGEDIPRYVVLFGGAWLSYVGAIRAALALPADHRVRDLTFIIVVAVTVRATLLFSAPTLSDDVFRAVWDARVLHAGVNPYAFPPGADGLAPYRDDEFWPRINAKQQRTPYPPVTELLGAVAYALLPERPVAFQALAAGFDIASAILLAWLLHRVGFDPRRSIAIAWSPVGAIHFAHSGHNDSMMIAALVGAGLLLTFDRRAAAMVALGLGTMVKVVPILAVAAFVRRTGGIGAAVWIATCAATVLPFASAGVAAVSGLIEEGREARFNESIRWLLERVGVAWFGDIGAQLAGIVAGGAVLLAAIALARRAGSPEAVLVAALRTIGIYLLVSAVVQPWYTTWLAPLVALRIQPGRMGPFAMNEGIAWLWLGGSSVLSELSYWPGFEDAWPLIRAVEYVPVYGILGWVLLDGWQRHRIR